jgi:hypothetical protein
MERLRERQSSLMAEKFGGKVARWATLPLARLFAEH